MSDKDIQAVFQHWRTIRSPEGRLWHPGAFPRVHSGLKEWKLIRARLADGYSVQDLQDAIDGMHVTPHNLGENERGRKYLFLELCMRDAKHVEMYRQSLEEQGRPVLSEKTQRSVRATLSAVERIKARAQEMAGEAPQLLEEGP